MGLRGGDALAGGGMGQGRMCSPAAAARAPGAGSIGHQ